MPLNNSDAVYVQVANGNDLSPQSPPDAAKDFEIALVELHSDTSSEIDHNEHLAPSHSSRRTCLNLIRLPRLAIPRFLQSLLKFLALLGLIIGLFVLLPNLHLKEQVKTVLQFIQQHKLPGAFVFIGLYTLFSVALLPVTLLAVPAGFIFHPPLLAVGLILASIASGAICCFLVGRYLFRAKVHDWISSRTARFAVIDKAISSKDGRYIICMLRLSPFIPFSVFNYVLSLTQFSLPDYLGTALLGSVPYAIGAVVLGNFIGDLSGATEGNFTQYLDKRARIIVFYLATLAIIVVSVLVTLLSRRALRRAVATQSETESQQTDFTPSERRILWWTLVLAVLGVIGLPVVLSLTAIGETKPKAEHRFVSWPFWKTDGN